ncbi:MAG: cysteine hydrolase family protein [Xanthobacteraceae bacterium]
MSAPKTLLQMAGAPLEPSRFSESAVIIIDAQNEYVNGKLPLVNIEPALDNIAILLKAARAASAPVIHVQHKGRAGGLFDPGADAFKLAPQAASEAGEVIIEKALPNAFAQTSLQDELAKTGRKQLIVAGFQTHMCISSTVRAALDLGYRTTVVADAAATRDLPDPTGGPAFAAAELHRAALAGLADRFAIVAKLSDLKA